MFGFIKNLLRKGETAPVQRRVVRTSRPATIRTVTPTVSGATLAHVRQNLAQSQNGRGIKVPLQPILSGLPLELQSRVLQPEVGDATVSIPLEKVLAQLSRGLVKITFGELRMAAPEVFSPEPDRDKVLVAIPLSEILPQLNPALIQRRRAQKHVEIPAEISSPFERHGAGLALATPPVKSEPERVPPARQVTPVAPPAAPAAPLAFKPAPAASSPPAHEPIRVSLRSAPTPPPPTANPPQPPPLAAPRPALEPNRPGDTSMPVRPSNASKGPHASNGSNGSSGAGASKPPEPLPASRVARPSAQEPIMLGLTSVADSWPEPIRKEIVQFNLVDARLALPFESVEQALKQGKITFTWKTLRSWIYPNPLEAPSPSDSACLDLPLSVVAPVFIERQRQNVKPHQKISIDEDIPNLFFGFPQPEAPVGANAKPSDTNFYVWDDSSDVAKVDPSAEKRGPTPGTRFVAKYATPNEVVSRASALEGVAGSLIALPDGLMVASRLPSDINGDTLAAFLPQIFGKVSACTKELRMGELNNLNFTVGNVPWKIFRVNSIFFAAFGRAGEPLPTAQLAALAAELDHKPK